MLNTYKCEVSMEAGKSLQLNATVLPTNATNKSLYWTSSDEGVATVDSNGFVNALKEGRAIITVKSADGNCEAMCTINVTLELGIDGVAGSSIIIGKTVDGIIVQNAEGSAIEVFTVDGSIVKRVDCYNGDVINLCRGLYILRVGCETWKIRI